MQPLSDDRVDKSCDPVEFIFEHASKVEKYFPKSNSYSTQVGVGLLLLI